MAGAIRRAPEAGQSRTTRVREEGQSRTTRVREEGQSRTTIGLVADLHGRFDPLLPKVLAGVERILVAGDIVDESLLGRLAALAPVEAVRGNNDTSPWLMRLPEFLLVEAAGLRILMAHDRHDRRLPRELGLNAPDVLLVGHSHRPLVEHEGRLLVVNPGSAGPKRFSLPRSAGVLTVNREGSPRVRLWDLEADRALRITSN